MTGLRKYAHALLYRWLTRRPVAPAGTPHRKLGILKIDRIGDFILATGAIRRLVEAHGPAAVTLIVSPHGAALARHQFPEVECVELPLAHNDMFAARKVLARAQAHPVFQQGVDTLVVLRHHRHLADELLCAHLPARRSIGLQESPLDPQEGELSLGPTVVGETFTVPERPAHEGFPLELECHRRACELALHRPVSEAEVLPELSPGKPVTQENTLGITPFGSASLRDLPLELVEASVQTAVHLGATPVFWGPAADAERYRRLGELVRQRTGHRVELRPTPGILDLLLAVAGSRGVVSTESGPAHLAAALDRPLVAILGGGHHGWMAPWRRSGRQVWLTHELECFHCNWHCHRATPECITRLPAQLLVDSMTRVMA